MFIALLRTFLSVTQKPGSRRMFLSYYQFGTIHPTDGMGKMAKNELGICNHSRPEMAHSSCELLTITRHWSSVGECIENRRPTLVTFTIADGHGKHSSLNVVKI